MRISDWSSDVCSSDLLLARFRKMFCVREFVKLYKYLGRELMNNNHNFLSGCAIAALAWSGFSAPAFAQNASEQVAETADPAESDEIVVRSEEHTSELKALMRNSNAVFCLSKKK